jgi:hypothetical protein
MKKIKRALAMTLVAALVLSVCSMGVFATDDGNGNGSGDPPASGNVQDAEVSPTATPSSGTETDPTTTPSSGTEGGTYAGVSGTVDNPINEIPVYKIVKTTANVALPSETFYATMVPATEAEINGATVSETNVSVGPALANSVISFNFDASDSTTTGIVEKEGKFTLDCTFTATGIYRYYIYEVVANTEGDTTQYVAPPSEKENEKNYIQYDYTKYTVDLYVGEKDGTYVVHSFSVSSEKDTKPEKIAFTNKVSCANIIISKYVDGTEYTKDEAFDFYIMIPVGGDTITLKQGETIQGAIYNSDKSKASDVSVKVNGDGIDADVKANGTKFQLKNGQYLELYAPVSMIYKVIEEDYKKTESYTTTVEYAAYGTFQSEDKEGKETDGAKTITCGTGEDAKEYVGVKGTTNTVSNTVAFTNSRHINVATGINLDFVPYVVVLALVLAAGGAVLVYKKKRTVR